MSVIRQYIEQGPTEAIDYFQPTKFARVLGVLEIPSTSTKNQPYGALGAVVVESRSVRRTSTSFKPSHFTERH